MHRLTNLLRAMGEMTRGCVDGLMRRLETARNGGRRRRMRVVESLALGGRRQLLLVVCDEQEYLVGTGPESVETIVPRQPAPTDAEHGGVASGQWQRCAESASAPAERAPRPIFGQAPGNAPRNTSATLAGRGGTLRRERTAPGPWLMTPAGQAVVGNRIKDEQIHQAEQGRGRQWQ